MQRHYPITGMHCHSCEILIEQHIAKIPGVRSVEVHHTTGVADVSFDNDTVIDDAHIERAVRAAGYRLGRPQPRTWISTHPTDWIEALIALCVVFVLYLFARILGISSITASTGSQAGALVALIVGLTAGISTCAALVGGLVLGFSARYSEQHPAATPRERMRPHLFFNLGRIVGFVILGAAIGAIGSALQPSSFTLGILTLLVGVVMVSLGIKLTELFPRVGTLLSLPSSIARALGITQDHAYSHWRAILTGALTFFLPCGFTQAMQLAAVASGSGLRGALIMGAFALGTAPGLLGIAGISSLVKGETARFFFKVAGIIVIGLGIWNISNGFSLTGIVLSAPQQQVGGPTAQLQNGKQYLAMTQGEIGYTPNQFTIKKGIPFVWRITSTNAYTCASSLVVPALGIRRNLSPGENVIEFTPTKTGEIRFSCSMGMFRGSITVIN